MKYGIIAALLLSGSAMAQTVWTSPTSPEYSNCCTGGECWYERGGVCHFDPAMRAQMGIQSQPQGTNSISPTCPKDREVVMRASGQYGCAADVQSPEDSK